MTGEGAQPLLVFGRTGQLARELARLVPDARFLGRDRADLSDPPACAAAIARHRPRTVINAAAWTDVDGAEADEPAARVVNAEAPSMMAHACAALGAAFVHVSTDYVFDGPGPHAPGGPVAPASAYGRTKLAGEEAVRAAGGRHAILRTSWVFSAHGRNFLTTMLRLGRERERISVVADQTGGPTPAGDLARACLVLARHLTDGGAGEGAGGAGGRAGGIWHFSGAPDTSWAGFAREIMARAGLSCRVDGIAAADWPAPARRPADSRLDCTGLEALGLSRPDWRAGIDAVLRELGEGT